MASFTKIKADIIYTNVSPPAYDQVLVLDISGKVLSIDPAGEHDPASLNFVDGILVPGFVNAHCHLELSHMKGKINTGTGLIRFVEDVVARRDDDPEKIQDSIWNADEEMCRNGIVAVGDICNRIDTLACKNESSLFYYSFVEMFDFWQDQLAHQFYQQYKEVYDAIEASDGHQKSAVPHAPYSVSRQLFRLINDLNQGEKTISIHNQETAPENEMFMHKQGPFLALFEKMGFSFAHFHATGESSIKYALENLDPKHRQLFVHNTQTTTGDIHAAQERFPKSYWVSCPNANLYIENRLPDYQAFIDREAKICLGTDSLTSNWQLSILEEMKTIAKYQSFISFDDLIKWATINGAEALGVDDRFGRIAPGKTPGINLIKLKGNDKLGPDSTMEKIC
ncbi:MAG: amidohydrolase family protein [Saprospiraceae bacterium]|nr:amidohydrolase family protein [Saprospiraceae bacterium]